MNKRLHEFYFLISAIPAITIFIRRLHDVNKSGYWLLSYLLFFILIIAGQVSLASLGFADITYNIIAIIFVIILLCSLLNCFLVLYWACQKGSSAGNKYGEAVEEDEEYSKTGLWLIIAWLVMFLGNFFINSAMSIVNSFIP